MKTVFLHIGLPKTASTYFQTHVFPQLSKGEIAYNPETILTTIRDLMVLPRISEEQLANAQKVVEAGLKKITQDKVLLSEEGMSLSDCDLDYARNLALLKRLFPQAQVLVVLRFQPDWCLAMYKQGIHQQRIQEVDSFINLSEAPDSKAVGAQILPKHLDYVPLLNGYAEAYGRENLHIFFFEELKKDNVAFVNRVCEKMGVRNNTQAYNVHYKSLSALSISALKGITRASSLFNAKIPYGLAEIQKRKTYALATTPLSADKILSLSFIPIGASKVACRLQSRFCWTNLRDFFQDKFDKKFFYDWDLLEKDGLRGKIAEIAYRANEGLTGFVDRGRIPSKYLRPKS